MEIPIDFLDVLVRLTCTVAGGLALGFDREERGRPAGLRTTLLVCLAAAAAMILANRLADTEGRPGDSYVSMDVMRLPLGVLTGVGFIGAGAILHRGNFVLGVTTAATLWFGTVMGFCFGAGELGLGAVLAVLGVLILSGLRWVERSMLQKNEATVTLHVPPDGPEWDRVTGQVRSSGYEHTLLRATESASGRMYRMSVRWTARDGEGIPKALRDFCREAQIGFTWSRNP